MSKSNDDKPITAKKFMKEFNRYQKGSISRRHFLGVTGLGTAMAVMGTAVPSLWSGKANAFGDLGDRLVFSTWPNYQNQVNLDEFSEMTGVNIQVNAFGSNEEMLAKLQVLVHPVSLLALIWLLLWPILMYLSTLLCRQRRLLMRKYAVRIKRAWSWERLALMSSKWLRCMRQLRLSLL